MIRWNGIAIDDDLFIDHVHDSIAFADFMRAENRPAEEVQEAVDGFVHWRAYGWLQARIDREVQRPACSRSARRVWSGYCARWRAAR